MALERANRRHPHLQLAREQLPLQRKIQQGRGAVSIGSGTRARSAEQLKSKLDEFMLEVTTPQAPVAPGIRPHLVFRVPILDGSKSEEIAGIFDQAGLNVVSFEADGAIVVFRDEPDILRLKQAIERYRAGPKPGINPKTKKPYAGTTLDVLHLIDVENMRRWQRSDRLGKQLQLEMGSDFQRANPESVFSVDVELWHPGTSRLVDSAKGEVRALLQYQPKPRERVSDEFAGDTFILLRVHATAEKLSKLADLDVVAEIEIPPKPVFDRALAFQATARTFRTPNPPPADAPSVCVIDSGIASGHPLLQPHVGAEKAILTANTSPADSEGHGTMVGGLAVFGDVRACYHNGEFSSPIRLFSARVLNDENRFDDDSLIVNQMRAAILAFVAEPYNCRVFNISLGSETATLHESGGRQKPWAEILDRLAREYKILIIVAAGNIPGVNGVRWSDARGVEAERAYSSYPDLLWQPDAGLSDPATAAIALTVGALAQFDAPALNHGDTTVRALASSDEPAPYSRTGPGINGAIKPEFCDYGGNLAFKGIYDHREIVADPGMACMSLSHTPLERLFDYRSGTSFAAPRVAHKASRIWDQLETQLGGEVHPNLVRAVMANSARRPIRAEQLAGAANLDQQLRTCGYGVVDIESAVTSSDSVVTLVAQGELTLDHFVVYGIPMPQEFIDASGTKFIDIALAFDPPVRSRRLDYLGAEMAFNLVRDRSLDRVIRLSRKAPVGRKPATGETLTLLSVSPGHTTQFPGQCQRDRSTLQRATAALVRPKLDKHGDVLWLVVKALNRWVPDKNLQLSYAIAVTVRAEHPRLYEIIRERVRLRADAIRQRTRT